MTPDVEKGCRGKEGGEGRKRGERKTTTRRNKRRKRGTT